MAASLAYEAPRGDQYWRLSYSNHGKVNRYGKAKLQDDLKRIGYKSYSTLSSASRSELAAFWLHHTLSHVCYDKCSEDEAKKFAIDRKLIRANSELSRQDITFWLIHEDMNPTFSRFEDLPPEIRTIVYEIYMNDFAGKDLERPTQPPLARATRLLRKEALPVFYGKCTFVVYLDSGMHSYYRSGVRDVSSKYLKALSAENVGYMRNIAIHFQHRFPGQFMKSFIIRINMSSAGTTFSVSALSNSTPNSHLPIGSLTKADYIEASISSIMGQVVARAGLQKLELEDFNRFFRCIDLS